jgi:NAD(P)-dependent dehydrogenase (short-subunit alcohol dehydrogenase family)
VLQRHLGLWNTQHWRSDVRLASKVAVITGGASGIGLASARLFVQEGARVLLGDTDEAAGHQAADQLGGAAGSAAFLRTDVASGAEVRRLVDSAVERYGQLDIMFNNAGLGLAKPLVDTSEEEFDRLVAVNLKGVFLGCKYALPHLLANPNGGVILNTSSNGGLIGRPGDPVYNATKHGVIGLTRSLALAYADQRIRVNALCPGPIATPLLWSMQPGGMDREAFIRRAVASCPTPRLAAAEEVASAALFLVSDESSFISGIGLPVDGAKAAGVFNPDRYRLDFELL